MLTDRAIDNDLIKHNIVNMAGCTLSLQRQCYRLGYQLAFKEVNAVLQWWRSNDVLLDVEKMLENFGTKDF